MSIPIRILQILECQNSTKIGNIEAICNLTHILNNSPFCQEGTIEWIFYLRQKKTPCTVDTSQHLEVLETA